MFFFAALTVISVSLAILLGWCFLKLFFSNIFHSSLEKLGVSFGLGLGLITFIEYFYLYFRLPLTPCWFAVTIAVISVSFFLLANRKRTGVLEENSQKFNLLSRILFAFIFIQGIWVLVKTFNLPIYSDDAVLGWGFRAKIIYLSSQLGNPLGEIAARMKYTTGGNYPLLISLAENYISLFLGEWNDLYPKIIFPLSYFSLQVTFFYFLKRFTNKNYALVFTFFLSSFAFLAEISTWAIADVPFTYYYFVSFILILLWMRTLENHYIYLSAIFSGLFMWTKNEGYPSFIINLIIIVLFTAICLNTNTKRKNILKGLIGHLIIVVPIAIIIMHYQSLTGLKDDRIGLHVFSIPELAETGRRALVTLDKLHQQLFGALLHKWNLLGYLFVAAILMNLKKCFNPFYRYILLAIALNFMLYTVAHVFDRNFAGIGSSQNRVLMHFIPLILFFSATILYPKRLETKEG